MFETYLSIAAFSVLCALSVYAVSQKRSPANAAFSLSVLLLAALEVADRLLLASSYDPAVLQKVIILSESLLPGALIFFGLTYLRQSSGKATPPLWKVLLAGSLIFPVTALMFPAGNFFYAPDIESEQMLFLGKVGYWFYMGIMVYCILALLNIEATFSSTTGADRWRIKFEAIGMGAILSVLIFYYSQGLLYRSINMNLIPMRSAVIIISSLLIGYSKLFRGNNVRIEVSRFILYRSLTLVTIGFYLLLLGLIGEGMRYFGVYFSRELSIFVAFASGIAILIALSSGRLRRKMTVLISKHFFPHRYDYRTEWLKFTEQLSLCRNSPETQDAILLAYQETFGLQGAGIYLLDREREMMTSAATHNLRGNMPELSAGSPLISYFREKKRVFSVFDDEHIPTAEETSFIEKSGAKQIVPLTESDDVQGFIVLGEQLVRETFTYEDFDLMKTFARQAIHSLMNMKYSEEIAETRELVAVARISSFVIHDLKNMASNLSLLLSNSGEYIDDPEFQKDMIETIRNTLKRMQTLMQRLKKIPEKAELKTELADIDLLVRETVDEVRKTKPPAELLYEGASVQAVVDTEEIRKVVLNLVLNAVDACGDKGEVRVNAGLNGSSLYIRVQDNGCGMTEDQMSNDLFRPFRSTKRKGLGIGLYQCKQIVDAHHGRIGAESTAGKGSTFTVHLPVAGGQDYDKMEDDKVWSMA
jgi:putative PEP-CTERM system histidine kinase